MLSVSGKDERPGIPLCFRCGKIPDYWLLLVEFDKWVWLMSDEYLSTLKAFKKVTFNKCGPSALERVRHVKCGYDMGRGPDHIFYEGRSIDVKTIQIVIKETKRHIDAGRVLFD